MKRYLVCLLLAAGLFIINCGNEPAAEFFNGTPADDSAITNLMNANPILLKTHEMFVPTYIPIVLDTIKFFVADSYFRTESTIVKQLDDSCALNLTDTSRFTDLWYAKDTTCTVYLWDTFTLISLQHYTLRKTGHYFWNGDTGKKLDTVTVDSTHAYYEIDNVVGEGLRHIYFEPKRSTTPDTLEDGTIVYPIIEPREWVLRRISYGSYYFPNKGADRPLPNTVALTLGGRVDTIFASNTDTLFHGHVMNRFRHIDSLLEYTTAELANDSIRVVIDLNSMTDTSRLYSYYAAYNGQRKQMKSSGKKTGAGYINLSGLSAGIHNLYFEAMLNDAYYYVKPAKEFTSSVWLVPIRIK
jgi:hypothetical protein